MKNESLGNIFGIYIYARPKNEIERDFNNEMLSKAEAIRCIRVQAIVNEEFDS